MVEAQRGVWGSLYRTAPETVSGAALCGRGEVREPICAEPGLGVWHRRIVHRTGAPYPESGDGYRSPRFRRTRPESSSVAIPLGKRDPALQTVSSPLAGSASNPRGGTREARSPSEVLPWRPARASADLLRQLDDDPLRAADVAEAIAVSVALHLADELSAVGPQTSEDGVDVVDRECDVAQARRVRRRVPITARARRGVELDQLESAMAVRGLHHREFRMDPLEPDDAVHPSTLDPPPALPLEPEVDEEGRRGLEVVDHDAHVVHASDRHALDRTSPARARAA